MMVQHFHRIFIYKCALQKRNGICRLITGKVNTKGNANFCTVFNNAHICIMVPHNHPDRNRGKIYFGFKSF